MQVRELDGGREHPTLLLVQGLLEQTLTADIIEGFKLAVQPAMYHASKGVNQPSWHILRSKPHGILLASPGSVRLHCQQSVQPPHKAVPCHMWGLPTMQHTACASSIWKLTCVQTLLVHTHWCV